jgi:Lrp/AsnC family leucine-responsive transcriptional regulator
VKTPWRIEGPQAEYPKSLNSSRFPLAGVVCAGKRLDGALFVKFRAIVELLDEVVECHMVAGGFDYLIKIRVADMQAYRKFLGERLASLPGIAQIHTYVAMEEVKSTPSFKF